MVYSVIVLPQAAREVAHIIVWWHRHRPEAHLQFEEDFEQVVDSLEMFPERGVLVRGGRIRLRAVYTRRTRHVVLYRVRPRVRRVEVVSVGRG